MQQLSEALSAHLAQHVMTLATCWKITRRDGAVMHFTDHDKDLVVDSATYAATSGIVPSAVTSQAGLAIDNLELEGMLSSDAITEQDLLTGIYDHAELSIFMVNYASPSDGQLHVKTGWLGEVTVRDGVFVVEVRGITSALQKTIGEVFTPTCRAQLGDARCSKSLTSFTHTGIVTSVANEHAFLDSARTEENGYYTYGTVTFTSGANTGIRMEIRDFLNGRFGLFLPMPYTVQVGDHYTAVAGCDKRLDTCVSRFSNAVNFRGEPHLPGNDLLFQTPTSIAGS